MWVRIAFVCHHCGEELGTERQGQSIVHDAFHECVGERVGMVAELGRDEIWTYREDINIKTREADD